MSLLSQLKKRRLQLGLKQADMYMRVGISRQQYQHIESKGNPRLDTLALIAKGLHGELMLIPHDKVKQVQAMIGDEANTASTQAQHLVENPWQGLLENDECK